MRKLALAAAAIVCATGYGATGASASASVLAASGSLTVTSDPGDFVGQGQSYSYVVPPTSFQVSAGGNAVAVNTSSPTDPGDFWNLAFQAPAGQQLQPGVTYQAQRYPFQAAGFAGLEAFGQGRGCNQLTGDFTILDATYGPFGYLESFDVLFDQFCDGSTSALHGELKFATLTPPPALALTVSTSPQASVDRTGAVTLRGTITCTQPVTVNLNGTVSETVRGNKSVSAAFTATSSCSPSGGGSWEATAKSSTAFAFATGSLQVLLHGQASDPFYSAFTGTAISVDATSSSSVTVVKG